MTQHTTPARERKFVPPNTCSGCSTTWTGVSACHCSGCHQTFAGANLFDAHRTQYGEHGTCRRPADMVATSGIRAGEPLMFFREGMWRGPEMTEEQKLAWSRRRAS